MTDNPSRGRPSGGAPPSSPARGLRLGWVRGVPIYLSPVALLFAALIASLFAQLDRDRLPELTDGQVYALAAATAVGLLVSLVLHELGHCLAALRFGLAVRSVTVYGFAGFTEIEPEPQTPAREFVVAVAGPLVNGVLAAGCWLGFELVDGGSRPAVLLFDLAVTNLGLFVFNLAPGLPLDGGRLVVSGVWAATRSKVKATRAGAYAGFVVAAALALWGVQITAAGGSGIWTLAVAAFLALGAQQSLRRAQVRERLPGLSAGRLARRTLPVDGSLPLAEALRRAT
ncbi:MAG TPA: site-2 protease family protein, partial [Frankiaceae bacterium]|nr:site-2 protease family protein [Frankiaceae bacterium]